jgi:hypothetical protein
MPAPVKRDIRKAAATRPFPLRTTAGTGVTLPAFPADGGRGRRAIWYNGSRPSSEDPAMTRLPRPSLLFAASLALAFATPAAADTLLVDRAQVSTIPMPTRGMSMQQVEARFGAPDSRLDPRGGQKRQWPTIHRWVYPQFTVYFERDRVIDAVANQASPTETGPKPAIR